MRDEDLNHYIHLVVFALVICVIAVLVIKGSGTSYGPPPSVAGSREPVPSTTDNSICGKVAGMCRVKTELKTNACKAERAKAELLSSLTDPLASEECQKEEKAIAEDCALGCRFDFGSLTVIPGELKIDFSPEKDESGKCFIKGRRTVSLSGICVRDETAVQPSFAGSEQP